MSLPATVLFNDVPLSIHDHQGQPWLAAADLARALGYANPRAITGLYAKHKDEFSPEMTAVLETSTAGGMPYQLRIFSPRGCHLVAMLARTPLAVAFRRWVLDVLEALGQPAAGTGLEGERLGLRDALIAAQRQVIELQQRLLAGVAALAPAADPATPVWELVARLSALGQQVNHARDDALLAINLPQLRAFAQAHASALPARRALTRLLLRSPRFVDSNRSVNSALTGQTVKCWVFRT